MIEKNHKQSQGFLLAGLLLGGLWLLPAAGNAETVKVPVGEQAKQKWTMDRPVAGMKQSQVEAIFGKPLDWREAVGDPPISSWTYPDFVVYFEYDHVIHSVLRQSRQPVASTSQAQPQDQ